MNLTTEDVSEDWTCHNGRTNSSPKFLELVNVVAYLIRQESRNLLKGRAESTARLIISQLAHVHGLSPQKESKVQFSDYAAGDQVIAMCDFFEDNECIKAGEVDIVESISSDHHGGLQLNLKRHGRGWSNHVWRKQKEGD